MSLRGLRRLVAVLCVAAIGGMIAASIADNDAAAMTAGSVAAIAVLCLLGATSAVRVALRSDRPRAAGTEIADDLGAEIEERVSGLVAAGADERAVRDLVGAAVRLGRTGTIRTDRAGG